MASSIPKRCACALVKNWGDVMALMSQQVVHIHPTLMCNLACAHCYSLSGPAEKAGLAPGEILDATAQLREQGYEVASISGGEPTVYAGLHELCHGLRGQGYSLSVITNGLLPDRVEALARDVRPDLLSVSFDGLEARHDLIRRRRGSFDRARESLRRAGDYGARLGAVVSFARDGIEDLPELVDLLVANGVRHVQFHPLSQVGRAREEGLKEPRPEDLLRVMVLARVLEGMYDRVSIDCDAVPGPQLAERTLPKAGDQVSPLVIGADGWVWPLAYGLPDTHRFARIGGVLPATVYSDGLAELVAETARHCAAQPATAYYPDLVRLAEAADRLPA